MKFREDLIISPEEIEIISLPEKFPASKVAEKIRLPLKSNIKDRIDLDLTPYLKLPISLKGKRGIDWVFLIAPTQSAKTVFLQIVVADTIDQSPGTLIYILPDRVSARKSLKEKLIPMIMLTPDLRKHIIGNYKRSLNLESLTLDNMTIYPAWAGSLASLSSTPALIVILDELRLMGLSIGDESNAIKLANDRLTTFRRFGLAQGFGVSTPSVEKDLLHKQVTNPTHLVLHWHIKCPTCKKYQLLDFFKNIHFNKITKKAECLCSFCNFIFDDTDNKMGLNKDGIYAPEKSIIYDNGSLATPIDLKGTIVCWYDSLVSPFRPFQMIWNEFISTKDDPNEYKNFWQCWLAKFWIKDISSTSVNKLKERRSQYRLGDIPEWTRVLTAGIDTQDTGFYVTVRAWGSGRKKFLVDAFFIDCKINIADSKEIYDLLYRDLETRIYTNKKNERWAIGLYAIDTGGHRTQEIYKAAKNLNRIILVKGVGETQKTTIKFSSDLNLYLVRTEEYLEETEIICQSDDFLLPENIHEDYLKQYVNIRKVEDTNKKGDTKIIWKKIGQCDYRFADIHNFICLDIDTSLGTFRRELEKENFMYNPIIKRIEEEAKLNLENGSIELSNNYESPNEIYEIGEFNY